MKRIEALNDFVVKFANVNGSGSASANELFAKAFLRMGIPVSPRNIFPSNIQGLPTWYEVRVTEAGHLGRRGGVDREIDGAVGARRHLHRGHVGEAAGAVVAQQAQRLAVVTLHQ